jgi:predicted tellurium resistance membrane protein TerC
MPDLFIQALAALLQVIMIDLTLAGDNAIVIGLAAAGLPREQRNKAILVGIVAATVLRIIFAGLAIQLLQIIGLVFAGGILLLWVCWKMWREPGDRVASLKTELKITEAQMPAWNKFADALLTAAKSMDESMDAMHKKMMESGAVPSLPDKLQHHAKMAAVHLANLNAIKAALDPLYASFSDDQKKLADGLRIGPMGVM